MMHALVIAIGIILGIAFLVMFVALAQFGSLFIQALHSGARVAMIDLIGMKIRGVDPRPIVLARIRAVKGGVDIPVGKLETLHIAGGQVPAVVNAMVAAKAARIALSWETATGIDLAGRDVLAEVRQAAAKKAAAAGFHGPLTDLAGDPIDAPARQPLGG